MIYKKVKEVIDQLSQNSDHEINKKRKKKKYKDKDKKKKIYTKTIKQPKKQIPEEKKSNHSQQSNASSDNNECSLNRKQKQFSKIKNKSHLKTQQQLQKQIQKDLSKILDQQQQEEKFNNVGYQYLPIRKNSYMTKSQLKLRPLYFQNCYSPTFKPFKQSAKQNNILSRSFSTVTTDRHQSINNFNLTKLIETQNAQEYQNTFYESQLSKQEQVTNLTENFNQVFYDNSNSYPIYPYNLNYFYQDQIKKGEGRKKKTISEQDCKVYDINIQEIMNDGRTTVMIKNIPNKYKIQTLLQQINNNHLNKYNFFYLPIDFKNKCNRGYAFINFLQPPHLIPFYQQFNGYKWAEFNSQKVTHLYQICQLKYARIQGRQALVQHFQHSIIMNQKDKKLKPIIKNQDQKCR